MKKLEKSKKKTIWDRIFLGITVFWVLLLQVMCMLLLEPHYREFITTIGAFFIPLLTAIGIILALLYVFIFKFPTLRDVKNKLADVYKKDNISKDDFDKLAVVLEQSINNQDKVDELKEIEHFEKIKEIEIKKQEIKQIQNETAIAVVKELINENESKNKITNNKVKESLESY